MTKDNNKVHESYGGRYKKHGVSIASQGTVKDKDGKLRTVSYLGYDDNPNNEDVISLIFEYRGFEYIVHKGLTKDAQQKLPSEREQHQTERDEIDDILEGIYQGRHISHSIDTLGEIDSGEIYAGERYYNGVYADDLDEDGRALW